MDKVHLLYLQNRVAYARDQAAYKKLYLYFHPSVYKFAASIVGDDSLAQEIVSDVMISIWTMDNKLAYVENLKSYVLTAARNTALTYLKRRKIIFREISETISDGGLSQMPDDHLITLEISRIIKMTVAGLPPKCRQAYLLVKEEGLSYKEASQILQVSQKTLEAHISAALKTLRRVLDAYLLKKKS
ncbi:RNA polymerase sigma factor [Niabella drilacis]|uniref:RNA polymerase sigma-70 factor, ECF subfamily n=1 Tax=Niabella drilacis (strain DSM 25811 / CCM 8410 / CCUG 62505 / LMG 26954 / E90) TaxID=1285928 RepID=A0A1G6KR65_NIADE|nr:sigma-70 family RNA polymerase sigma factor [Niabella drilacis]SDC33540.1 RNA polymerase sigma-70 factor, ECF subfamily [Niabella drilacis]